MEFYARVRRAVLVEGKSRRSSVCLREMVVAASGLNYLLRKGLFQRRLRTDIVTGFSLTALTSAAGSSRLE